MKRLLWSLTLSLAIACPTARARGDEAPQAALAWTLHEQGQLVVVATNNAVAGVGFAISGEKGLWAAGAEAQILPVVICDDSCGYAYSAGLGVAAQPALGHGLKAHLELVARYYLHPHLHQYVPAIGPRVGLRWPDHRVAVSLDIGISFAAAHNFDLGAFGDNKIVGWGIPELILGLWF
jgi:hypothetical protein